MPADPHDRPSADVPTPEFTPDARFVDAVRAGVARHRHRTRRRATAALAMVAVLAGSGVWWINDRLSDVQRVEMGTPASTTDPLDTDAPFNVLVLGVDCSADLAAAAAGDRRCADPAHEAMSDTIAVVHVDPGAHRLDVLDIYRDVAFDPSNPQKLNSLGVDGIRAALDRDLGIDVAHVVVVDYSGFLRLVSLIDPRVRIDTPVRDVSSGLRLETGCRTIEPQQWLALVRSRHLEYRGPTGDWVTDPSGDLGRVARQQAVGRILFDGFRRLDPGPSRFGGLVDALVGSVAVDDGTSNLDLVRLARLLHTSEVRATVTLPVTTDDRSPTVFLTPLPGPDLDRALAPFTDGRPSAPATEPTSTTPNTEGATTTAGGWADLGPC